MKENPGKTVYRSNKDALQNRLYAIGEFIHSILPLYDGTFADLDILQRVFNDQYEVPKNIMSLFAQFLKMSHYH